MSVASQILLRLAAWSAAALPAWVMRGLYRSGPLAGLLRGLLNRAAPPGPREVRIAGGSLRGRRLILDLQSEKDHWLGTYEPVLQAAIARALGPGQVAYDIGANIGYTTMLLAEAVTPEGWVVAFEPLPANFSRLQENLTLNPHGKWVEALPAAVGDRVGKARFLVHASRAMGKLSGSAGRSVSYEQEISVELVTIDDYVLGNGGRPPDLVKIDVEGGERGVLAGMRGVMKKYRPTILLELHGEQAARGCFEILKSDGYKARALDPEREFTNAEDLPWKSLIEADWAGT